MNELKLAIRLSMFGGVGGILAMAGVGVADWKFWFVMVAMVILSSASQS